MDAPTSLASVMVVDDTPANLRLLDDMLRQRGYRVLLFPRGALALRAARANPPDLILLDVMMPDMDGFEVCRQLKADPLTQAVPVIFISALTEADQKVQAFASGAVDYVAKPFHEAEVAARVQTHLLLYKMQQHMQNQQGLLAELVKERSADLLRAQEVARVGSWKLNLADNSVLWSQQTYRLFGVPEHEPLTLARFLATVHEDDRARVAQAWQRAMEGEPYDIEHRIAGYEPAVWVRERAEFEFDERGKPVRAVGTVQDVTDRKSAELALQAERLRLQTAVDAAQAGTWEWDVVNGTNSVDSRSAAILGYSGADMLHARHDDFQALLHPDDRALEQQTMARHLRGELPQYEVEIRLRHRDGHYVWCRSLGRVMQRGPSGEPLRVAGLTIDITKQKTHLEQLDYITHHDPLTHLPNRARFVSQLAAAMAQQPAQPMGVAYLDLDGFSRINDTYGRELGSELILEVGRRLQGALADGQHLGHIGGDEFAVILPLDGESFEPQLRHLLDAVARPLTLHGHTLQVSASLGFSRWPQHDKVDAEQLLRQADQAMYRAKLAGKNRHHLFDPVTDEHTRERYSRIDDIRLALAQREFVLFYQPKVNLCNGELLGLEALIRWQHPSLGLLTPAHFIPALDGHPLAITLGDWVIEAALAQLAAWKAQGFETRVSVNIDRLQLQDPLFATRLQAQVAAQPSLSAGYLELEILETGALENMGQVSALIRQLQGLGFECALDDFGTGYSSLTFLKQLGANTIKIDQSFVRGLLDDAEHAAIVHSVVGLASNFERVALAEGVETIEHGQALIEFGCEQGQGYAIARPMPAAALADWRARWQLPPPWRDASAIAPRDLPLLLAEVEHRGWMRQLQDWLNNPDTQATPPNRTHCRFGHWLQRPATLRRFDRHPDFLDLQAAHDAMHERVQVLAQARAQGTAQTLAQEWADLSNLAQRLSSHLRGLRTAEADSQWPPA